MSPATKANDLRRDFSDRAGLVDYLRDQFPAAAAIDDHVSEIRGGRHTAETLLQTIQPARYAKSRNFLDGAVTRLSMYLRHGVFSLAQMRDRVLGTVRRPQDAAKLLQELAWRDYFQRVWAGIGDGIWQDREPYKTGFAAREYATELPADIPAAQTGLPCMDAFVRELHTTGYLHNHARMWLAAYVVHWRRVRWQAGARWFQQHLLDGDTASNNLSWQWVASTFSAKPYFFNRENLDHYTNGAHCPRCPLRGQCPFEGSYDELAARIFPKTEVPAA